MKNNLNKNLLERYSRQIVLKNVGVTGQKNICSSKVLIIGMGGLGCPVAEFLTRAGVGDLGIIDSDNVDLSNIHRQSLYDINDLKILLANEATSMLHGKKAAQKEQLYIFIILDIIIRRISL